MHDNDYQQQVALACRALALYGCGSGIGGHISMRVPGEEAYWTNVLDKAFEEMLPSDIVKMDFAGKVVAGDRVVSPGIDFHHGIYQLRPDVNAIVHSHGFWVTAQAAMNRPPKMWHNLATYFWQRCAMSPDDSIAAIAPALGEHIAILIPWHGAITVSESLGRAAALHVTLEYVSELDVRLSATPAVPLPADRCDDLRRLVESADYLEHTWQLMLRKAERSMAGGSAIAPFEVRSPSELVAAGTP